MAALDGASYSVEVTQPIGKGMAGIITLRIGKDRPGEIRAHCGAWRATDRSQEAAAITIDSTGDHGPGIHVHIGPPTTSVTDRTGDDGPFKPTAVMEKISRLLEATREPLSFRQLEQAYRDDGGRAKRQTFADAVNLLADGKHIAEEPGPRNARMFRSANVYRQRTDPESDAFEAPIDLPERPSPDRPPTVPRDGETTVPHHRPPVGAVGTVTVAQNTDRPPANQGDTPDRPTGPGWQLDYLTGEYISRETGEVWDGSDQ